MSVIDSVRKHKIETTKPPQSEDTDGVPQPGRDRLSIWATIFEPWSNKPDWFLSSRPVTLSPWYLLWLTYGFLQLFRVRWIPIPYYWGSTRKRTKENYAFIYENENKSMGIFAAISAKGGALKTTVATWMAATFGSHTKGVSIVFDADSGALSSAAKRLEAYTLDPSGDILTADSGAQLVLNDEWEPDYQEFLQFAPRSMESGVYVMSMNGITNWSDKATQKILQGCKRACGSLFVDTGPGEKESNTKGVVQSATVVIVTGIHQNVSTDDAIKVTLDTKKYNLRNREDRVLIAIGAVGKRHFNKRTQYELARQFEVEPERVVLLPHHKRILKGDTVRMRKISGKFLYAMSELNRKRVEAAIAYNENNPLTFPQRQQSQSLEERRDKAAAFLLYTSQGNPDQACQFIFDYAAKE